MSREIRDYLEGAGFRLVSQNSHQKWSDGKNTVTVPVTPSCRRSLANVKALVRRLRRNR